MPYNNTAIPPSEEVTGTTSLPLARVKKTIAADEDIGAVSAQAAFVITKATELFIQYATERSHAMARADPKPKRSLTYTHVANAVARTDNLEFLSDIVPQTTTVRAHRERKARDAAAATEAAARKARVPIDPRQATLDGQPGPSSAVPADSSWQETSLLSTGSQPATPSHEPTAVNGSAHDSDQRLVFQHYEPAPGDPTVDGQGDVQMS